ncbi:MAG: multiheme c-type cytochrome [Desulfosoma sp.]
MKSGLRFVPFMVLGMMTVLGMNFPKPILAAPHSAATQDCLSCHVQATPGIVSDWQRSRHAKVTPGEAMAVEPMARKVSSPNVPQELKNHSVGCAECHTLRADAHKDTVEHHGYKVYVVTSPEDCRICHQEEAGQYQRNLMAHAHTNLMKNPLYGQLVDAINGLQVFQNAALQAMPPMPHTNEDSCLSCHGTDVQVRGTVSRDTDFGEMDFVVLTGWPNVGVGRLNPDGSNGSCASCHVRHSFSIEVARKPETCSQCHKGPDVPAYKVYSVSKHGNLYGSQKGSWNFTNVPWVVGKDMNAPTCATCHVSLLVDEGKNVVAQRSHAMNDRLPWRIFGLVYAHPHPREAQVHTLRSADGLTLPTNLDGTWQADALIDETEQGKRRAAMQGVCRACHGTQWVQGHWERFEKTILETNRMTKTATDIMVHAWKNQRVQGPPDNPFDEPLERRWVEQWLFFANSIRFSSAMMGADYSVFDNGRWFQSKGLREMEWMERMLSPGSVGR